jgi:hypothetical protein
MSKSGKEKQADNEDGPALGELPPPGGSQLHLSSNEAFKALLQQRYLCFFGHPTSYTSTSRMFGVD